MNNLELWRLSNQLTVFQVALLMAGSDPSGEDASCESWPVQDRPIGYEAAKRAVKEALINKTIEGTVQPHLGYDATGVVSAVYEGTCDIKASVVDVSSLKKWLRNAGVTTGFFFPASSNAADYLDRAHPRYAPKLAAAVKAWLAVDDPKGKHPKQALTKWLREHGSEFGLSDEDGRPNEQGIEECAKVANWQLGGGAPKTPGG